MPNNESLEPKPQPRFNNIIAHYSFRFFAIGLLSRRAMQTFSIRHIETLTGIKAHTLRIWGQRFAFFKAQRKDGHHRIYSNDDLRKLLCVAFLYHNDWKVSKIASLSDEEVATEVRDTALTPFNHASYVLHLFGAALAFNEAEFSQMLNELVAAIGFERTVLDVCYPYLQRVGLLWNSGTLIPAQEHFASYLIQSRIISETEKLSAQQKAPPEIVLFCPENEHHELSLLFLNYLLRKNGWSVLYLGCDVKLQDLKQAAGLPGIRFLYLHLLTNFTGLHIDDYLAVLRKTFPDKAILASGQGVQQSQRAFTGLTVLRCDEDIRRFIGTRRRNANRAH